MSKSAIYLDCSPGMADLLAAMDPKLVGDLHLHHGDPAQEALPELLKGFTAVFNGHTVMSADLMTALRPALEHIVFLGTGAANYVDLAAADRLGVKVATIANYGDQSVAEHAAALMFSAARDIAAMHQAMRRGEWLRSTGTELAGKTVGVVGMGGVGRAFAAIAQGIGMRVLAWNRRNFELPQAYERAADLKDLFARSDVISLHLSYTEETRKLIDAELLGAARPGTILVNTARAEIVDPKALHQSLMEGPLAHAAIDVFSPEPPLPDDPLLTLPNVTLSAHVAWNTPDASRRLLELGLEKLWAR
jgi:D-3-phosphoglycerate dehydrogenase / 2-oxoglutarate reductase